METVLALQSNPHGQAVETTLRSTTVLLIRTQTGEQYWINADGKHRRDVAQRIASHLGMRQAAGEAYWRSTQ